MDTALSDPFVGRLVDGRYRVVSRIARGGMATVYLATDTRLEREVALKVMHPHLADDQEFVTRFHREAKSAARMSHPGVVAVYDQGADGDTVYLAMEHVSGATLRDELNASGQLTPREALDLLDPILDALAAAHRAGVVHRDVKPENVLLTDDGRVKVADFGLARAASATATATTGMLIGTVAYLSPELVLRGVADARTDVYAAGILLFEMLTGRQPFSGDVPIQVAYQHVHEDVPTPGSICSGVPEQLDDLVRWATARDPDERPADARELLDEVRRVRGELTDEALDRAPGPPAGTAGASEPPADGRTKVVEHRREHVRALTVGDPDPAPEGGADGASGATGVDNGWGYGPRGRRRRRGLWALVAVLVVAVGLGAAAWYWTTGPGAFTVTPNVVTQQVKDAEQLLATRGLDSEVSERFDEVAPVGQVLATRPEPGQQVRKNGTVELFVSQGSEFVAVPPLGGLTLAAATTAVTDAELAVAEGDPVFDEKVPEGSVVSQAPPAGEELRRGEDVTLVLSKGREPIEVPAVVDNPLADAVATIKAAKLVAAEGEPAFSEDVPKGSVISQDPADGTLFGGDTVTLVVSLGPPLVVVPNVTRQQVDVATRTLEAAGFEVAVDRVLGGIFGTVRSQDPAGGAELPLGSTVTLTIV